MLHSSVKTVFVVLCLLMALTTACGQRKGIDTFHIYFDLNVAKLDKNTERRLDLLIYNDRIINGSEITIVGYADYLGSAEYNKNLSMQRAQNIKKYLVKYGIDDGSIKLVAGRGEINRAVKVDTAGGVREDRKVDIVVNNNVYMADRLRYSGNTKPQPDKKNPPKNDNSNTPSTKASEPDVTGFTGLKKGATIRLNNVYFSYGSHVIKEESYPTLERLYATLVNNPELKIKIEGHVCCIQDVADAMDIDTNEPKLSVNRARSIYDYLITKGIDANRLEFEGFGKRRPVVPKERTEADAEQNRRVEIRVLSDGK